MSDQSSELKSNVTFGSACPKGDTRTLLQIKIARENTRIFVHAELLAMASETGGDFFCVEHDRRRHGAHVIRGVLHRDEFRPSPFCFAWDPRAVGVHIASVCVQALGALSFGFGSQMLKLVGASPTRGWK